MHAAHVASDCGAVARATAGEGSENGPVAERGLPASPGPGPPAGWATGFVTLAQSFAGEPGRLSGSLAGRPRPIKGERSEPAPGWQSCAELAQWLLQAG